MSSASEALALAFTVQFSSTILFYPYRDLVRQCTLNCIVSPPPEWYLARWKGMMLHPTQPALLSVPITLLFGSYAYSISSGSPNIIAAAIAASSLHGLASLIISHYVRRIGNIHGPRGLLMYSSALHCIKSSTSQFGIFSWLAGFSTTLLAHAVWYGGTIATLGFAAPRCSFGEDMFWGFRTHAIFTVLSAPVRNTFQTATFVQDRNQMRSLKSLLAYEGGVWNEGLVTTQRMVKEKGLYYLFQGCSRTVMETSVPFAFMFAAYRYFGGRLRPSYV